MPSNKQADSGAGALFELAPPRLKQPPMYQVVLLNDDFTPMDFVVDLLKNLFSMDERGALNVTMQVHTEGQGSCGTYSRDVAETKAMQVKDYARGKQYPLNCTLKVA